MATPRAALAVAEKLIARIEEPIPFNDHLCRISASIGITGSLSYRPAVTTRMLADVDAALYASKRLGKGRATVFAPGMVAAARSDAASKAPQAPPS